MSLEDSDILIMISDKIDVWAADMIEASDNKDITVIKAIDHAINLIEADHHHHHHGDEHNHGEDHEHGDEHNHGEDHEHEDEHHEHKEDHEHEDRFLDPHIWLDFENNIEIAKAIEEKLIKIDSENAEIYQKNAQDYIDKITQLDNKFKSELANCQKDILVSGGHNAFNYLANRYGFEIISAHGLAPDSEPSPQKMKELIDIARENEVEYVIFEDLISPKLAEAISEEINADVLVLNPAGNISKDQFENKISFIDLMEDNLENLKKALKCNE